MINTIWTGLYQGAKYFSYNGEVLDDIRTKFEQSQNDNH